jgi:heme exporter protein A
MAGTLIQVAGLTKSYGYIKAIKGIDLSLAAGDFLCLFGPNGAGKTTLIRILSTLIKPTSGRVEIAGYNLAEDTQELRSQIGVISHATYLYGSLTALENIKLYAKLYGMSHPEQRARELIEQVGLAEREHHLVRTFSRGMQQRLSIARALIHQPRIILLDEPYTGLDQHAAHLLSDLLNQLNDGERTIILISHNLSRGLALANRVAIMVEGKLIYDQPRNQVKETEFEQLYCHYVAAEAQPN